MKMYYKMAQKQMVNLNIEKAVEIIFNKESSYAVKDMTINGIENAQETFWFLTKLLKAGIVYMFKDENGNVNIDRLTQEDFQTINMCMRKLGVNVEMQVCLADSSFDSLQHEKYIENSQNSDLNVAMSYMQVGDLEKLESHILLLFTYTKKIIIGYTFCEKEDENETNE